MWFALGTSVLFLGWFFFNGGSTYTLYGGKILNSAKVITNTILAGGMSSGTVFLFKKPIHLFFSKCFQVEGKYYKAFRSSQRNDVASCCNGLLAGLVAVTAPSDAIEPWAAVCIGIIAGLLYSCFSKLLLTLNIDDPLEAASVHYINGIWGCLSCFIFDSTRGFVSGSPLMG
jgi:ammonium transporter, Amt family